MVTGATSLSLVRDELFATMEQAEQGLEQFIAERQNGSLLQHAVECLQQIRGTLNLIELAGAELLAQEALQLATDIPTGVSEERDGQLAALGNALYVLRRYLENVEANRQEIPELLLPAINEVRCAAGQPALPESFFFSARLDIPRPPSTAIDHLPSEAELGEESRRMRHMYQIGLLGLIREQNLYPSLKLMGRALARLDSLHGGVARSRLCWIGAAAIESIVDLTVGKNYHDLAKVAKDCAAAAVLMSAIVAVFWHQWTDDAVRFLGYVPDESLPALFARCDAYVCPSITEGFGMPVLEAMIAGAPIIASNGGAIPEVAGNLARYFNPNDPADIARALGEQLLSSDREQKIQAGFERAKQFTWERCARLTVEGIERVMEGGAPR